MFDIGMAEMVVIGVVALIVVGPKDLPVMFRRVGQVVGRMRGMARDFQRAMDQAADDSGLREAADGFKTATSMKNLGLEDAAKSLAAVNADYQAQKAKKVDAAAEHAARQAAVEDANKAAENWSPESVDDGASSAAPKDAETSKAPPAAAKRKPATKKAASKSAAGKKSAVKSTAKSVAKKPTTKKAATKKPASREASTKKTKADSAGDAS